MWLAILHDSLEERRNKQSGSTEHATDIGRSADWESGLRLTSKGFPDVPPKTSQATTFYLKATNALREPTQQGPPQFLSLIKAEDLSRERLYRLGFTATKL